MVLRVVSIIPMVFLVGCTTIGSKLDFPLSDCEKTPPGASAPCVHENDLLFPTGGGSSDDPSRALLERFKDEPWTRSGRNPSLGIGLSGGGSKAAPFAMGVLKRFAEEGWLQQTDVISSVSGGGYAAYYLYSHASLRNEAMRSGQTRALEETMTPTSAIAMPSLESFFVDARRVSIAEGRRGETDRGRFAVYPRCEVWAEDALYLGYAFEAHSSPPAEGRNDEACRYSPIPDAPSPAELVDFGCTSFAKDARRHQHLVSCYQDVLSPTPGGFSNNFDNPPYGAYIRAAGQTVATWPAHHFANSLFDWKLALTPSRRIYRKGIARTYGQTALGTNPAELVSREEFTFDKLRSLYDDCAQPCMKLPWWVMNATNAAAGESRHDIRKSVFEITPASFGSGQYGYVHGVAIDQVSPSLRVIDAVAAAGAFFDTLSTKQPGDLPDLAVFSVLHAMNLRWGYEIANYNTADGWRVLHSMLPWPLYYIDRFTRTPKSRYIRIADGGMSGDNIGIYALLRRGTRNIVVVDGAVDLNRSADSNEGSRDDRYAAMSDLCKVGRLLAEYGLDIEFSRLPDASPDASSSPSFRLHSDTRVKALCLSEAGIDAIRPEYRWNFNPYRWQREIWRGQVIKTGAERSRADVLIGTNLYYIKSAVNSTEVMQAVNDWAFDPSVCEDRLGNESSPLGLPCTLVGYFIDNSEGKSLFNPCDWTFPMTQTVGITANSSSNHYNAQRDLGWYLAGQLASIEGSGFHDSELCRRVSPDPNYSEPRRLPLLPETAARLTECRAPRT